jgi:hypothetical protein
MGLCECGEQARTSVLVKGEYVGSFCDWCMLEKFNTTTYYDSRGVTYGRLDMGGKMSREKGGRGEREVYKILQPIVDECYTARGLAPPLMQRNSNQSRAGGYDIVGLDWMALEVKRQEKLAIPAWWDQTLNQCGDDQEPVLFYRKNRRKWQVIMLIDVHPEHLTCAATLSLENFLVYFRVRIDEELDKEASNG